MVTPTVLLVAIPEVAFGQRLDRFLGAALQAAHPEMCLSRSRIQSLINGGHITLDGKGCRSKTLLRHEGVVRIEIPALQASALEPVPMPLDILFEDRDIIAINKPAGLVVHPGAGSYEPTLVHGLLAHCQDLSGVGGQERPGIVHRLDRFTSGVLVVAKNDFSHQHIAAQFAARTTQKTYRAWVWGRPKLDAHTFDTFYGRHPRDRILFSSKVKRGKRAITHYTVTAHNQTLGFSELEVRLETGRTHQIRVHCHDAGHAIMGDVLYGARRPKSLRHLPLEIRSLSRHALHADTLVFDHPRTNEPLSISAPLPNELEVLARLVRMA